MSNALVMNLGAIIALIPAALMGLRKTDATSPQHWLLLAVATIGPITTLVLSVSGGWHTDFATSLWVSIAASMGLFSITAILTREAWRLTSLMAACMIIPAILATIWTHLGDAQAVVSSSSGLWMWVSLHIIVSIGTYGLVTIAAVAALGAVFQEHALKTKRRSVFTRSLPSVTDCDKLVVSLLIVSEIVLVLGLMSGMALQFSESQEIMVLNHKTILTLTAFIVIGGLLIGHFKSGLRGRKAARFVLLAYLLLTLGYPGVKFVSDIIL